MATDHNRLRKIAGNLAEGGRKKQVTNSADVRRDVEEIQGTDIVDQEKLVLLAKKIWMAIPLAARPKFTSEHWRAAIHDRCLTALMRAEERLAENKVDERMFIAKVKILRQTFAHQVVRAMQSVVEEHRA